MQCNAQPPIGSCIFFSCKKGRQLSEYCFLGICMWVWLLLWIFLCVFCLFSIGKELTAAEIKKTGNKISAKQCFSFCSQTLKVFEIGNQKVNLQHGMGSSQVYIPQKNSQIRERNQSIQNSLFTGFYLEFMDS